MRIAIATDGKSVSKQFSTVKTIEIFEVKQGKASNKIVVDISGGTNYKDLSYILQNEDVNVLICGLIKDFEKKKLEDDGIRVFLGARGSTSSILNVYLKSLK